MIRRLVVTALVLGLMFGAAPVRADDSAGAPKLFSVYYNFGEVELTPEATAVVDAAAQYMASSHLTNVDVVGNTDTAEADQQEWTPDKLGLADCKRLSAKNRAAEPRCSWKKPDPMKLGLLRAKIIAARLVVDGVPRTAIHVSSAGASNLSVAIPPATREPLDRVAAITIR